jgi:hypothetical protein
MCGGRKHQMEDKNCSINAKNSTSENLDFELLVPQDISLYNVCSDQKKILQKQQMSQLK